VRAVRTVAMSLLAAGLVLGATSQAAHADAAAPTEVRFAYADGCDGVVRLPYVDGDPLLLTSDTFEVYLGGVTLPGCGPIDPRP
jgi:hypothetical protein